MPTRGERPRLRFAVPYDAEHGAVIPILALNGYKIANPTVLDRITDEELFALFEGYGYRPIMVAGDDPAEVHRAMAATFDDVLDEIARIQRAARGRGRPVERPRWPMIMLRTPKGWTGPKEVDGQPVEGTFRAHQVPMADRSSTWAEDGDAVASDATRSGPPR